MGVSEDALPAAAETPSPFEAPLRFSSGRKPMQGFGVDPRPPQRPMFSDLKRVSRPGARVLGNRRHAVHFGHICERGKEHSPPAEYRRLRIKSRFVPPPE